MKKLEEIEEEYINHNIPNDIKDCLVDPYVFLVNIEDVMDEIHHDEVRCSKMLLRNSVQQKIIKFMDNFVETDNESLDREKDYLIDETEYIRCTLGYVLEIATLVNEDNYMELAKLLDFMIMYYAEIISAKESRLISLKRANSGIEFIDFRFKDTSKEIKIFMDKHLNSYSKNKQLEKKI